MSTAAYEIWLTVPEAFPQLRRHFRTQAAFRHHLRKRETNGLTTADAVRMSPLGKLLVNPDRVAKWAIGEGTAQAA
jgi:hypothetical protein